MTEAPPHQNTEQEKRPAVERACLYVQNAIKIMSSVDRSEKDAIRQAVVGALRPEGCGLPELREHQIDEIIGEIRKLEPGLHEGLVTLSFGSYVMSKLVPESDSVIAVSLYAHSSQPTRDAVKVVTSGSKDLEFKNEGVTFVRPSVI